MQDVNKSDAPQADDVSAAALRLARIALGISQKEAALASGVGWRTMQRIELDEPVSPDIRGKVKSEWERRGVVFLAPDASGWGIRVPKSERKGPIGHQALKALRVGLGLSIEQVCKMAHLEPQAINMIESDDDAPTPIRDRLRHAYTDAGVKFLAPGKATGWGFRIPATLAPERGRVLLERPSRKGQGKGLKRSQAKGRKTAGRKDAVKTARRSAGRARPAQSRRP